MGRYDGSSKYAKDHRWAFFPSASVGWRISEEKFFKPLTKYVDNLKIRASFGALGNQLLKGIMIICHIFPVKFYPII